jgi:hypothetical protein
MEGSTMNRDIRFRVCIPGEKFMELPEYSDHYLSLDGTMYESSYKKYDTPNIEIERSKEVVLEQFTGLKDKNGVDVYEGDIVIITGHGIRQPFEVRYFAPSFNILCVPTNVHIQMSMNSEYEIIGNIHQNPELL